MKTKLLALALLAACSALPMSAMASENLSYTFVEGGYVNLDGDADGAYLRGSYQFSDSGVYVFGSYARTNVDNFDIDINPAEIGLGYKHSFSKGNFDMFGEVAKIQVNTDFGDFDGFRASIGARKALGDHVEGLIKANYVNGDDFDSTASGTVGVQYKFNDTWGINGEVEFIEQGAQKYNIGVRASF